MPFTGGTGVRTHRGWALTEDVDKGEIDSRAAGGATPPVKQGLRIEGRAPGEEINPSKEARKEREEADSHYYL